MKAFASDFDGTIYFVGKEEKMKPDDVEAIRSFQRKGMLFGVCTGRSMTGIIKAEGLRAEFDFYILANGARILDAERNEIYKSTISKSCLIELYEHIKDVGDIVIHANDTVYTFGKPLPLQIHISSFDELDDDNLFGISVFAGKEKAHEVAKDINREFYGRLTAYVNKGVVDIVCFGCSKGKAMGIIKERLGIDTIAGIGDSYNDVPMLSAADVSFTFKRADCDVREKADYIVDKAAEAIKIFESLG